LHPAVGPVQKHDEEMLQADPARLVADDVDVLRSPRLIRAIGDEVAPEADHLEEVEARAKGPGHGEDGAPVALESREPRLPQRPPRGARLARQLDRRTLRRAAARRDGVALAKRPREG